MKIINVLSQSTIDMIAAGEVIERPKSVVKELIENSIDAGASAVSVEISGGGKDLIRVTDNGEGIDKSQIKNALKQHATSKIKDASDLSFITSLGFRGEALSSISSVSELEICTKTKDSLTGAIYKSSFANEISLEDAGLPQGTTIIVRNLFGNTPARLKFLKSDKTEAAYIQECVLKTALSNPDISFKFASNGAVKLNTPGNGSLKDTVYALFGRDIASHILKVSGNYDLTEIEGYIGSPEISRQTRALEYYFVNGRCVQDKIIQAAIEAAYKGYQMKGSYPFTALNIKIEPELLDVNVHPGKLEVRFFDEDSVYNSIVSVLKTVISGRENIPEAAVTNEKANEDISYNSKAPEPFETNLLREEKSVCIFNDSEISYAEEKDVPRPADIVEAQSADTESFRQAESGAYSQQSFFESGFLCENAKDKRRVIGQAFDTYWFVEYEDKVYIIDQHAAHEKVLYERFMNKLKEGKRESQLLSPGLLVSVTPNEQLALSKYETELEAIGFKIEPFGGCEFLITEIPAELYSLNSKELFLSFLNDLSLGSDKPDSGLLAARVATAACKAAVKGNMHLSVSEAEKLIDDLMELDNPYNCPHGRPTIISVSKYELEKKFKRII